MSQLRTAFFVSDSTGITAEMLGHSVVTQFSSIPFEYISVPFVDSRNKAEEIKQRINTLAVEQGVRPIVFSTLVNTELRQVVESSEALFFDCFQTFIGPLEQELGIKATRLVGLSHGLKQPREYQRRIDSVNFAMAHDDGASLREISQADVILIGVSRSGKTPTCLYLALQYGVKAANYPLTPEDLSKSRLPDFLLTLKPKLFGLTIHPERLRQIRSERRPNSEYARLDVCDQEVRAAESLMRAEGISFLDTTVKSIEEISASILKERKLVGFV